MYATPLRLAQQLSILWWPGAAQSEASFASSEQCVVSYCSAIVSSVVANSAVVGELESGVQAAVGKKNLVIM